MSNKLKMAGLSLALILGACGGGPTVLEQAEEACVEFFQGGKVDQLGDLSDMSPGGRAAIAQAYGLREAPGGGYALRGVRVYDDGRAMMIDGLGEGDPPVDIAKAPWFINTCLLSELEVPLEIVNRMDQTNALMGLQEAAWNTDSDQIIVVGWVYQPQSGLDLVFELMD